MFLDGKVVGIAVGWYSFFGRNHSNYVDLHAKAAKEFLKVHDIYGILYE